MGDKDHGLSFRSITEPLLRSRSGGIVAALTFSTLATGMLTICVPLELRRIGAGPGQIGLTLSMFGFGMFAFEGVWGIVADRAGYRRPLIASQLLYALFIAALSFAASVPLIAVAYFFACGMMVAVGPIARSYLGTALHPHLRATGLAMLASQWAIAEAVGAGVGGPLIDRVPIHTVVLLAAVLPVLSALVLIYVFRNFRETDRHGADRTAGVFGGRQVLRVLAITASLVLLVQIGLGGELALLPLLVTDRLQLSAGAAGAAMLAVGLMAGVLLIPGGRAADRWGRRRTMIAGGVITAGGYVLYALSPSLAVVIAGAALRALGAALIWPAATAWVAESVPRARHAFFMGVFGEFENIGVTIGPIVGGFVWSIAGIQGAFYAYAAAALLAGAVAAVTVAAPRRRPALESVTP